MNISEDAVDSLLSGIEDTLEQERTSEVNSISGRVAESDANEGVSVTITGGHIPIRPALEYIARTESWRVENVGMIPDAKKTTCHNCDTEQFQSGVNLFCAYESTDTTELANLFTY